MNRGVFSELGVRRDADRWVLSRPLIYRSERERIYVPLGFSTDLASIPRVPGVYAAVQGRANKSAVVHDWLYHRKAPRQYADRVFREAMLDEGVGPAMARMIYTAVRLFGWLRYRRRRG